MKTIISILHILLFSLLLSFSNKIKGQNGPIANKDSICIQSGAAFTLNVLTNDSWPGKSAGVPAFVSMKGQSSCFRLIENGNVTTIPNAGPCCGTNTFDYNLIVNGQIVATGHVIIVVKCAKPNCTVIDLNPPKSDPAGGGTTPPIKQIYYACEDSPITYFVDYVLGYTYTWTAGAGGTISPGMNAAEVIINWSNSGPNTINLITNTGAGITTQTFCVDVLPAPIAAFTTLMNCVCNNSPISFTNTSTGASSYFWDFGDTNTSTQTNPTHMYSAGGTYIVTLYAYSQNYDPRGNPLCCCVDTAQMVVTVDPKPGPDILWISTLCEGDTSKYWTTAAGCSYVWSVLDANGSPLTFTGQGNDTICVVWGSGPHGYVTLDLNACSPAIWCEKPVTALVPIISTVESIDGETIVCAQSKEEYTLPKWNGTIYNWTVTGGMVVSGQGSHDVVIMWGNGPTGTIHVDYWNPFLQGLPGHDGEECKGHADLTVFIRPEFSINQAPPQICKGTILSFATNLPSPPTQFTWTINPPQTGWPKVGVNNISYTFNNTGFYTICCYPNNPNKFCNDTVCTSVNVTTIGPADSISGPKIMCPGKPTFYTAYHSNPSVQYNWTVVGGTPSSFVGNPISVVWNATGPYSISVKVTDLAAPMCMSTTITCPVVKRVLVGPLTLTGGNYCINSIQNYSIGPVQDPLATFTWSILGLPTDGSVYSGQGTPNVSIQWNNTAGPSFIKCVVKLCNDSLTLLQPVLLKAPILPNITQIGTLCPGNTVTLNPGAGPFTTTMWSGGTISGLNSIVSSPGLYVLTTTDMMGCTAKASFTVNAVPGPSTTISTPNFENVCVPNVGYTVKYTAVSIPGVKYQWYCNGTPVTSSSASNTMFTHTVLAIHTTAAVFNYQVKLLDTISMCMGWSNIRTVYHSICTPPPPPCSTFPPPTVTISGMSTIPLCNKFNFSYTSSGIITPVSWTFGDPFGTVNNPGPVAPMFTYSSAGIYQVTFTFNYTDPASVTCQYTVFTSISVPVAPKFTATLTGNCREVKFKDMSGVLGTTIVSQSWNFDDLSTPGSGMMTTHVYASPGTYNVTLTVTTASGCIVSITMPVIVPGVSTAAYTIMPNPACVGDQVMFMYSGSPGDILTYLYNFGDGSNNGGPAPKHAYLLPGNPITTTLTVTDIYHCTATTTMNVVINPNPPKDTIKYTPKLKVCQGQTVTLTAPLVTGGTYMWNTGATTQIITVNTAGTYAVTVTNANNCKMIPDSVVVRICPLPLANISGPHFICDNGCVTLNATLGYNFHYQWYDELGNIILNDTMSTHMVCDYNLASQDSVSVLITDAKGCSNLSAWHKVKLVVSPNVSIAMVPSILCAQTPNLLTASATPPTNIVFSWSTGATSAAIIAIQVGTYTVYATDTITGCVSTASKVVNPIPDFCELPSGCYETCNPDTLCGPPGMLSYQWNFNGVPITTPTPETMQCLEVKKSGSYSLTAVNTFGCSATSDTLILQLIQCCDTADTKITALPVTPGLQNCCYKLSYVNTKDSLLSLFIYSNNADITLTPGTLGTGLTMIGNTPSSITIATTTGNPLPKVTFNNFMQLCASNITSSPVVVYFSWLGPDGHKLCLDSISLPCNPSECVYIQHDTIKCLGGNKYTYTMTVCNPITNTFSFTYLDIVELLPVGVVVTPGFVTIPALAPGNCTTLNFTLNSSSPLANNNFCFNLIAHEFNPLVNPAAKCCSIDTTRCIFIPGCTPCDSVFVEHIDPVEGDSCCYIVTLNNYQSATSYGGIMANILTSGTTVTLNNALGSGWTTTSLLPNTFTVKPQSGHLPLGSFTLPEFCVSNPVLAQNFVVIKWLGNNLQQVKCRDTIEVICENECGYDSIGTISCINGVYTIQFFVHNTTSQTVYSAAVSFSPNTPAYNTIYNFPGGLAPGGVYGPLTLTLGAPFGTSLNNLNVCMLTNLHNQPNDPTQVCCQFKTAFKLPICVNTEPKCECNEEFEKIANLGFNYSVMGNTVTFIPVGPLTDCDKVIWDFYFDQISHVTYGNQSVTVTFPSKGEYQVCMTIIRTTPSGKECKVKVIKDIKIKSPLSFKLSPNPASESISVSIETNPDESIMQHISIFDDKGVMLKHMEEYTDKTGSISIPLQGFRAGLYLVRLESDGKFVYKKFIKME